MGPKSNQHLANFAPTYHMFFVIDSGFMLVPIAVQNYPQNDPQIEPNGTLGRSGGRLGERWDAKDVPVSIWGLSLDTQNNAKITKINP